jgi:hypothetical protein
MSPVGHRFAAGKFADEVVFLHRRKSGKWDHLIGFARPTTAPSEVSVDWRSIRRKHTAHKRNQSMSS